MYNWTALDTSGFPKGSSPKIKKMIGSPDNLPVPGWSADVTGCQEQGKVEERSMREESLLIWGLLLSRCREENEIYLRTTAKLNVTAASAINLLCIWSWNGERCVKYSSIFFEGLKCSTVTFSHAFTCWRQPNTHADQRLTTLHLYHSTLTNMGWKLFLRHFWQINLIWFWKNMELVRQNIGLHLFLRCRKKPCRKRSYNGPKSSLVTLCSHSG